MGTNYFLSQVQPLADSNIYNIKDPIVQEVIVGTQTSATGSWTGESSYINALYDGLTIKYFLPRAGSGNATLNLTLADGTATGAIPCYIGASRLSTHYGKGSIIILTYFSAGSIKIDGTATSDARWIAHADYNVDTYTSAYCSTGASTAAKTASCNGYTLTANTYLHFIITNSNTKNTALTMDVNGKGAKPIYINGNASSSSNYNLPAGSYLGFYDGTNWQFRTDGIIPGKIEKLGTARAIDGVKFDGSANISHYGVCSTAAATAAKEVSCTSFDLVTGARIIVTFSNTNSAANPTLNVNGTGAKAIQYRGAAITAGQLAANRTYEFVYDGTAWQAVGDFDTNTNTQYSAGTGLSLSGTTFNHSNSITSGTVAGNSGTLSFGGTITIPKITYDAQGHITATTTTSLTLPANPNTHHQAYLRAGGSTGTGNAATTTGNTHLILTENDTRRSAVKLAPGSNMAITSDSGGTVTFTATDTKYSAGSGITLTGTTFSLTNNSVGVAGNTIALGGSVDAATLRESLGLSSAMRFRGVLGSGTTLSDGSTTNPVMIGTTSVTAADGDVVIDTSSDAEYVWANGAWERLGPDGSYKVLQSDVASPATNSNTKVIEFIDTITQNQQGVITATKGTIRGASTSQTGIVQLSSATNSTSTTLAATASAVKAAYDLANGKVATSTYSGHTHTVSTNTYSITGASYKPAGTVSVSLSTNSGKIYPVNSGSFNTNIVTGIGNVTWSAGTGPNLGMSVNNELLTFTWSSGTLPSYSRANDTKVTLGSLVLSGGVTILSGASVSSASFSGTSATITPTLTSGTVSRTTSAPV